MASLTSSKKWKRTRQLWFSKNPPKENGLYDCAFCGNEIRQAALSLDHIIRATDLPQFKHQFKNLRPMHAKCNSKMDKVISEPEYAVRQLTANSNPHTREVIIETSKRYKEYEWLMR